MKVHAVRCADDLSSRIAVPAEELSCPLVMLMFSSHRYVPSLPRMMRLLPSPSRTAPPGGGPRNVRLMPVTSSGEPPSE
eukprot:4201102-Prymnesium_polylepis.1